MERLVEWLRTQYGRPGAKYRSARQLSLTAEGNENLVKHIEERGVAKVDTLFNLARALDVSPVFIIALAADLNPEELAIQGLQIQSPDEAILIDRFRKLTNTQRQLILDTLSELTQQIPRTHP